MFAVCIFVVVDNPIVIVSNWVLNNDQWQKGDKNNSDKKENELARSTLHGVIGILWLSTLANGQQRLRKC